MYQVFKNKRALNSVNKQGCETPWGDLAFTTYEEARQALRRYIRKLVKSGKAAREQFRGYRFGWDHINRNPVNFTRAGFRICKVA